MGRLADKNFLITGGNSGIGLAAAQEFDASRYSSERGADSIALRGNDAQNTSRQSV